MSDDDIEEKLKLEVLEEFNELPKNANSDEFIKEYKLIELELFNRIQRSSKDNYTIYREQKIGDKYIDILMRGKGEFSKDYIIEIKLRHRNLTYSDLKSAYLQIRENAYEYRTSQKEKPTQS